MLKYLEVIYYLFETWKTRSKKLTAKPVYANSIDVKCEVSLMAEHCSGTQTDQAPAFCCLVGDVDIE